MTLAGIGTAVLLGLALAAFVRKQSRPFLLIVVALVALLARSIVAALAMTGSVSSGSHHTAEHVLDVVLVGLVIGAVYYARSVTPDQQFRS